jgi:hypothetical protein
MLSEHACHHDGGSMSAYCCVLLFDMIGINELIASSTFTISASINLMFRRLHFRPATTPAGSTNTMTWSNKPYVFRIHLPPTWWVHFLPEHLQCHVFVTLFILHFNHVFSACLRIKGVPHCFVAFVPFFLPFTDSAAMLACPLQNMHWLYLPLYTWDS